MATDFGTCISATTDLPRRWSLVSGPRAVAEALVRRWNTARGRLPSDENYGTDARLMIGETQAGNWASEMEAQMAREAEKDERVEECAVAITYNFAASSATVVATVTLAAGPTFRLVASVDDVTVTLLRVE